ncbi:murein biosynthesis integral membrane protein MurJ [Mahella sp.]|uniref:murein biosynthesis integral membrane protein MurJ n=1 Tax=Mahella sp. TaxID=2798721 RepID=UPI0025BF0927|nr:murein biosynthesis integral membrane protein MurJ [Mahella sp.]MBZ4665776.1 integral rane protein MviN [Mahella sp.]
MADKNMGSADRAARAAAMIMIFTLISKLLGFGREMAIAARFGATMQTDAYKMGQTIPMVLLSSVAAALGTTFIPVLTEYIHKKSPQETNRYVSNVFNVVILICLVLTGAGMVFAPALVRIVAPGFSGEVFDLTVTLSRIMFPLVIFNALAALATGYLQAHRQFAVPAMVGIPFNIVIIGQLMFFSGWGIYGLAAATVLAVVTQLFIQWPTVFKSGYKYSLVLDFKDPGLQKVFFLVLPVLLGTMAGQINTLVDRMLASGLAEGSVSALDFANRVNGIVLGIFVSAITTVLYPTFSSLSARNDVERLKRTLNIGIRVIIMLTLPMMTGLIVLRYPIIQMLFERGAFDARATNMTATALLFYSIGLVALSIRDLTSRAFYAMQDTRTPTINGVISVAINVGLNLILVRFMGLGGLALATSIAVIVTSVSLIVQMRAKLGGMDGRSIAVSFVKLGIASAVMGLSVYFIDNALAGIITGNSFTEQAMRVGADIISGALIYAVMAVLLKVEELRIGWNMIKQRIRRGGAGSDMGTT